VCKNGIDAFGNFKVTDTLTIDGFKYMLENDCWCMVRASGTEPVLRIYAEGNNQEECMQIIAAVKTKLGL
jgi:phosphomannomutase